MSCTDIRAFFHRQVIIRNRAVTPPLLLAPMAGLGHVAFRELVAGFGGFGLLFTGMCSARAVPHENPAVSPVFRWRESELPFLVCQIFGSEPVIMAEAARRIEQEGFWGVDLNFGCSVSAICKKGAGAALLKTPERARQIVEAVRSAVDIPVLVKFRTGWDNDPENAARMAAIFESAGADALTFHPRVAPDRRNRPPVWEYIRHVRQAVSIPVFGNGNVFELTDAARMIGQTGCAGISVGRMAVARPWLFAQWTRNFMPDSDIFLTTAMQFIDLLTAHYDDKTAVKLYKTFVPYFSANFKFGHQIAKQLKAGATPAEIRSAVIRVLSSHPETVDRPNQNLFVC